MKNKLLLLLILFSGFFTTPVFATDNSLKIEKIAEGVYLHTSFKQTKNFGLVDSNGLVVINNNQAYIIDTPWSEKDTQQLLNWLEEKGYQVTATISTHFHSDRTAGLALLNTKNIATYTSTQTQKILATKKQAQPRYTFAGDDYSLVNGIIEVYYPGAGHTKDNLVVWLPKSQVLFGGCIVRAKEWQSLGNVRDATVSNWANAIKNIQAKKYPIQLIVPGHGKVGESDILTHTLHLAKRAIKKATIQ